MRSNVLLIFSSELNLLVKRGRGALGKVSEFALSKRSGKAYTKIRK